MLTLVMGTLWRRCLDSSRRHEVTSVVTLKMRFLFRPSTPMVN